MQKANRRWVHAAASGPPYRVDQASTRARYPYGAVIPGSVLGSQPISLVAAEWQVSTLSRSGEQPVSLPARQVAG